MGKQSERFAKRALVLVCFFLLSGSTILACQFDLCVNSSYGQLSHYSLTITREIHSFSFAALEGDRIIIRMNRTSGTLEPRLELYSPEGNLIGQASGGGNYAQLLDIGLTLGGNYEFRCMDAAGPGRGEYNVSLQSTNRPGNVRTIQFDDVIEDSILQLSQMDAYRFYANAGEAVIVQAIKIGGDMDPRLELFDPSGIRIGTSIDVNEALVIIQSLSYTGFHTILVSDDRSDQTGRYYLILHRLPTDVDENGDAIPNAFSVEQNYPNPFNPNTTIDFSIARSEFVSIDVFNILGERIRSLADRTFAAGEHSVEWDGRDNDGTEVASGIYYYRITAGEATESRKMVLLK